MRKIKSSSKTYHHSSVDITSPPEKVYQDSSNTTLIFYSIKSKLTFIVI